jgi:two-component system NtrC family response regulator
VDVRVICATHRDLPTLIVDGAFRQDLYYRISEVAIQIPPLRDREGDVPLIARMLLNRYCRQSGRSRLNLSPDALKALKLYPWPGNVRELENRLKRAVIMCESDQVTAGDLELEASEMSVTPLNLRQARERAERRAIQEALNYADGNISQTAELLGVTRPTLYALIGKHDLKA